MDFDFSILAVLSSLPSFDYRSRRSSVAVYFLLSSSFDYPIEGSEQQDRPCLIVAYYHRRRHRPIISAPLIHGTVLDLSVLLPLSPLLERISPLVEDTISTSDLTDSVAQECVVLKKLPLGAQILRYIGRAYRRAGQQVLRQERFKLAGEVTNTLQKYKHMTKHILEAAAVGGKLIVTEEINTRKSISGAEGALRIEYHFHEEDEEFDDNAVKEVEKDKASKAELESLQIEALWKISKIHLDRAINDACKQILEGKYFFFPSDLSSNKKDLDEGGDG